jgi:hypothetical protein
MSKFWHRYFDKKTGKLTRQYYSDDPFPAPFNPNIESVVVETTDDDVFGNAESPHRSEESKAKGQAENEPSELREPNAPERVTYGLRRTINLGTSLESLREPKPGSKPPAPHPFLKDVTKVNYLPRLMRARN